MNYGQIKRLSHKWLLAEKSFKILNAVFFIAWIHAFGIAQTTEPLYEISVSKYLMGTRVEATAVHSNLNACKKSLYFSFQEMDRVEKLLGYNESGSEISRINQQAGISPVKVSLETFSILGRAKSYAEKYEGVFDVSIGVITELWGFNGDGEIVIPDKNILDSLLYLVNFENIILNENDTTAFLGLRGMKIDLGGIAKGYAIDRAVWVLKENGIQNFLINAGGDLYVSGRKSKEEKWSIGIKHPRKTDALLAKLILQDFAVATSGDYERYIDINGKRYHHIINPKTGYPSDLCQSVSILAPTAEEADVLATYLFLTGFKDNKQANKVQNYIIMDSLGNIHFDQSLANNFSLSILGGGKK